MTDEQVMLAVKLGDIEAMRVLYERYHVSVFRFILNKGFDKVVAEDVVHNVFERLIKYRSTYHEKFTFKSWLFKIAHNLATDEWQKQSKQSETDKMLIMEEQPTHNQLIHMEREETLKQAQSAFQKLSSESQQIIWLCWNENMKYSEIGEILGLREGNVRVKVHRALKNLRIEYSKISNT